MLLEEVAVKCMVNSNLAKTKEEALTRLREEFLKSYPTLSYETWNKDLDETTLEAIARLL
jgi:hypothetical protein